jgi:hypothetical protein
MIAMGITSGTAPGPQIRLLPIQRVPGARRTLTSDSRREQWPFPEMFEARVITETYPRVGHIRKTVALAEKKKLRSLFEITGPRRVPNGLQMGVRRMYFRG